MTDLKFEDALARLEEIVQTLESGNLPLDESLKVFEEGIRLARSCAKYLEEAERKIELLTKDEAGLLKTQPFSLESGEEEGK
ncbi:MAG: exodeoxyribonuclease VII small subunit [Candidatus Rokubacteria bacterium RIFCSPLOWO2_02_FULL_68_19]|jgi:exodeoxyribonuclease VII small subunit|nr:MAG: exodeoxyribonuclease VII small subunit [Candidatus Rokubacteria bacterium RIFCSPLOWO2_02_FULL_68_19]OGL18822.1 MAG: exodeoxyribonuclease VII small subunit [Candidatus Rokubacteria bacterium RIFCSPLOWO2_12_FULL_69_21]